MKKLIFIALLCATAINSFAQSDTIYLDSHWKECIKDSAKNFRIPIKIDNYYIVNDYSMSGTIQMTAECSSLDPFVVNGRCVQYDDNGFLKAFCRFKNNEQQEEWTAFSGEFAKKESDKNQVSDTFLLNSEKSEIDSIGKIYDFSDLPPEFVGGEIDLQQFLVTNLRYPMKAKENNITGRVYVAFVVNPHGDLVDLKILRSPNEILTQEALRVVRLMPRWKPALYKGKPISCRFNLPISFNLN